MEHPLTHKIRKYLEEKKIEFKEIDHDPAPTCEESAAARGEPLKHGGKTLLFKGKKGFALFVLSAAKQVDNNRVRKILKSDKLRFAHAHEFKELTGTVKGALPPFGEPILNFDLYLDESIFELEKIAFNAGVLTKSFIMSTQDYLSIVKYHRENFSKS